MSDRDDLTSLMTDANLPEEDDSRRALAQELASQASDRPESITDTEMTQLVALLRVPDVETRVQAAEALQHLYERPTLFAPVIAELVGLGDTYPETVDGIPSPQLMMSSPEIRTVIYVADSLARVAQRDPALFAPVADQIAKAVVAGNRTPKYYVFVLGLIHDVVPEAVPEATVKEELCTLLDRGHGFGYPSWAADTLRRLGDPSVLPELEANYPENPSDETAQEAFDEAIAELKTQQP
ncbi:ARM domain protein (plasmid) [Halobacterium salinarum R1]|uniref:ARM domain protein n=1 Tax=Halobacterium salinarum (strain ATCC 29341 / DSM 671 / R1) TaxID=478009 RepID=B0R979_HALS3|nr:ARM domain protein [Halobacterium salinarum R1]